MQREKKGTGCRGSFTLEAALVIPLIISVFILLVFALFVQYHRVLLTRTATLIAQETAYAWGEMEAPLLFTDAALFSEKVSRYAYKNGEEIDAHQKNESGIIQEIYRSISRKFILPEVTTVEVHYKNWLLYRRVKVLMVQDVAIPLGWHIMLKAEAQSGIYQPAQYIRNLDVLWEFTDRLLP